MEKMTQAIIDNQTLAVDTIGATLTSMAFLTAVGSALDAMGRARTIGRIASQPLG